ncbi:MAG: YIP1 family protein [Armatimonadetes bacterium]|nr:YIP1 family protein [Armatimonadota bacterium]
MTDGRTSAIDDTPGGGEGSPEGQTPVANNGGTGAPGAPPGFLELVYGVLFEPVAAFPKIVQHLPIGQTVLIFTLVNVLVAIMSGLLTPRLMHPSAAGHMAVMMKAMTLMVAILGLVYQYAKWFIYSALLHLLAEFLGGRGRAVGVWTVAGLASLPGIFLVPANLILFIFGAKGFTLSLFMYLFGFIVLIWGMVLLALGIRQEHALSTGKAVAVVLLPVGAVLAGGVVLLVAIMATATSLAPLLPVPKFSP